MRIPRVYHLGKLNTGTDVALSETASQHVQRVLRLRPGAELRLFNGEGGEFEAVIINAERGRAQVKIGAHHARDVESPLPITLAQGISRGERMDLTLQKSVELGVAAIAPVVTSFCQVKLDGERMERRHQHWEGVITAACEQCGRTRLPLLHEKQSLMEWLAQHAEEGMLRIVLDHRATQGLSSLSKRPRAVILLVGPEGGLEESEIDAARQAGYLPLSLGPRVLRTETAGLTALAALQTLWGDLG
ncbi:MAG: 16S rRNA (uracil(1498)-N(3))-methyltransferase [Chromatiales bacterium]|jgi:16S rRNA (uracil1498-N3)-methyltransferase|nr:16S rRNA (uracil(1498)-N(3))-methyltransferase [Chromatiales bacterium]